MAKKYKAFKKEGKKDMMADNKMTGMMKKKMGFSKLAAMGKMK